MTKINNMSATTNTNILKEEQAMTTNNLMKATNGNLFDLVDKDIAYMMIEDIKFNNRAKSGASNASFTKSRRKNQFSLLGTKEDRAPKEMTMVREGVNLTVKAEWIKKTDGTLNKKGKEEVERLVQEGLSFFSRSDVALAKRQELGRPLTRAELSKLSIAEFMKKEGWVL